MISYISKRYIVSILITICFFSCKKKNTNPNHVVLKRTINHQETAFSSQYQKFPFRYLHEEYPLYYDYLKSKFKNLPKNDYFIVVAFTDNKKFIYDLYNDSLITIEKYKYLSNRLRLKPEIEKQKSELQKLFAITGIENDMQYLQVDTNGNYDFGDEKKILFDFKTKALLGSDILYSYLNEFTINDKNELFERTISIQPDPNYFAFQRTEDSMAKQLAIVGTFQDYWQGSLDFYNQKYTFDLQGYNSRYNTIYIKSDSLDLSSKDEFYNKNFAYKINDTIQLGNNIFRIDSLKNDISKLYLKKLDYKTKPKNRNRIGDTIDEYNLKDIEGEELAVFSKNKNKYTLLNFWGTWCLPCREMTPEIKTLKVKYSSKLQVIGVAFDKSLDNVQKYCKENDLDWKQVFIGFNNRDNLFLKNLEINEYPTLILIDEHNKIVFRGSDISSLREIEKILTSF